MFVAQGARNKIVSKRKAAFYENYVLPLLRESENLNLDKADLIAMIERGGGR
jgi:hypothetical protein